MSGEWESSWMPNLDEGLTITIVVMKHTWGMSGEGESSWMPKLGEGLTVAIVVIKHT